MPTLVQDLRLCLRHLRRRPMFTLTAVLTLAIGMGVNAVAFTVVNGVLFKGSALRSIDDFGRLATIPGGDEGGHASLAEYERFEEATRNALELAAEGRLAVAWRHEGTTETAWVLFASSNYFQLVDARPIAGRIDVTPGDGGMPSVVVGERFWRTRLDAAPLAGLTLQLNDTIVGVAGVVPESFSGPAGLYSPDVWLPLEALTLFNTSPGIRRVDQRWLFLFGRIKPGVSLPEVQGHIDTATAAMAREWPDTHRDRRGVFRRFNEGNSELRGLRTAATVAMGIIGLVLLLACFNVANLLLARAVEREREMGIRTAVGARPGRLVRLVITEGFVIAALAGVSALVLAWWTQWLVGSFAIPIEQPQHIDLTPDVRVVGFIALLVLIAGILPGLWPALSAARVDVFRVLVSQGGQSPSGRPSPLRRWLVGTQIAGSTAFLAIAALFMQSYGTVSEAETGFARNRLLVATFEPASHGLDPDRSEQYVERLLARVRALPGVSDVAIADRAPFFIGYDTLTAVSTSAAPCAAGGCPRYATMAVRPGYFKTMGIALTSGQEFRGDQAVEVVVNQPLARQLWPDGRGVGETIRLGDPPMLASVVGVTATTRTRALHREQPTLYVPLARRHFEGGLTLVARTAVAPDLLLRPFTETAQAVDPNVSMLSVKTMEQRMAVQLWPFRTVSWLFSICGALALVLATVGLAGVVIHAVNRRVKEFGVRVAVGATPGDLVSDVLRSSAWLLVPGLAAGTMLAAAAARLVQAAFVGVDVLNPVTYAAVAALECAVVVAASIGPALRASRIDALTALRAE
jgi:predicted permease